MKYLFNFYWVCIMLLGICFAGCADVDLKNVDMTTSINTSISLPVGSISTQFGDFIGSNKFQEITIDEQGRYLFLDTIHFSRSYHPINLSDYVSTTTSKWNIAEEIYQLEEQLKITYPELSQGGSIQLPITIPEGITFDMEFPIVIDLTKLNVDYSYQRVDSLIVDLANFTSQYTLENINFNWTDIKKIQLLLNENFHRKAGDTIDLLLNNKDFGHPMPIEVSDFNLILMKDPNADSNYANIVDSITLKIRFVIETSKELTLDESMYIGYNFELNFIDYSAMYGYFAASTLMRDEMEERPIHELWDGWNLFNGWVLPVSEPSVKFIVDHTLAVPMKVNLRHLYTRSENGELRNATFDASQTALSKSIHWPMQISVSDPLDKHAYDTILLDYTLENGNIDNLMSIHPYSVSYAFYIETDTTSNIQQFRITDNTNINLAAILSIPFAFNENAQISYSDTIKNIQITSLQLDSLLQEAQYIQDVEEAELTLYFAIHNNIPFQVQGQFTFYNANDEMVKLSTMKDYTLHIALDYPQAVTNGVASAPSENHFTLKVDKEDFDALASIKYIVFDAALGENGDAVCITPDAAVTIQLGVTTKVNATINLQELF